MSQAYTAKTVLPFIILVKVKTKHNKAVLLRAPKWLAAAQNRTEEEEQTLVMVLMMIVAGCACLFSFGASLIHFRQKKNLKNACLKGYRGFRDFLRALISMLRQHVSMIFRALQGSVGVFPMIFENVFNCRLMCYFYGLFFHFLYILFRLS